EEWATMARRAVARFHGSLRTERVGRGVERLALRGATIIAVCAGSGMDAELLARAGAGVVAADISPGAARRIAERARRFGIEITPIVADAEQLPFREGAFDVSFVHDGLHHLADPLRALEAMARVALRAVCVTEPARSALTSVAVKVGVAQAREEAGNEVRRFSV